MKKSIAILLLLIHGFNLAGYPAIFAYLQHKASSQIIAQIDNGEFNDAQLVEVRIPYPLPYSTNWNDYERVNGEVEYNGIHYNYVKKKLANDTLFLMCLPNQEKTKLSTAKHDYFNVVNGVSDHQSGKKSQSPQDSIQKSFGAEYNLVPSDYTIAISPAIDKQDYCNSASTLITRVLASAFQPPEA